METKLPKELERIYKRFIKTAHTRLHQNYEYAEVGDELRINIRNCILPDMHTLNTLCVQMKLMYVIQSLDNIPFMRIMPLVQSATIETTAQTVLRMQDISVLMRGQILDVFTTIEKLMDEIIRKMPFENEPDYDKYMDSDVPMTIKKKLFKMCIVKYEQLHPSHDLKNLKDQIDNIIDKRNVLAHWILDTKKEGIEIFKTKGVLRYFNYDYKKNEFEHQRLSPAIAYKLEQTILAIRSDVAKMQNNINPLPDTSSQENS